MAKKLDAFYAEWLEEFQGESDRACAVLAAALLERALDEIFRAFFLDDAKVVDQLLLRLNFYTQIEAAFALGLIGDVERSDLHLIREIRNAFAHQLGGVSFRTPKIKNRCLKLQAIAEIGFPFPRDAADPTRFRFISAVVFIAETLRDRMKRVTRREKPESMKRVAARLSNWGA
jgi:hypothetical protein